MNTQPWKVAVVSGKAKFTLQSKIETAFRNGVKSHSDYQYYPQTWIEEFKIRRKECGLLMYKTLGISREDKEKQLNQWASNYRAFDAPVMLLLATGIFPLYLLLMALLMIPLSINKYFFKKEKVKTEVQISVALILMVGFYYFIILDKDLSRPFEILFITLGGDVLYLYRIFLNVFIY